MIYCLVLAFFVVGVKKMCAFLFVLFLQLCVCVCVCVCVFSGLGCFLLVLVLCLFFKKCVGLGGGGAY